MTTVLTVRTAVRAAVTDLGRFGLAHYGVPTNGIADLYSGRSANILVGNPDNAPLVQITATDYAFVSDSPLLLAVTGAPADFTIDGVRMSMWTPIDVPSGAEVRITAARAGLHTYLAINGVIETEWFRGSCAPDPLLGIGRWLSAGDRITLTSRYHPVNHPYLPQPLFRFPVHAPSFGSVYTLDVLPGPEAAQFGSSAEQLTTAEFVVSNRSDHVGTRLEGPVFVRSMRTEILSRGVPLGAIEVPPAGDLIALQRGRPITAGYPVIAVVARASRDRMGQLRPGDRVRMREVSLESAQASYRRQQHQLDELRARVRNSFNALNIPILPRGVRGQCRPAAHFGGASAR